MLTSGMAKQVDKICFDLYFKRNTSVFRRKRTIIKNPTNTEVRILQNDWLNRKNQIFRAYIHAIRNAKKEIIIVGSYFFPSRKLSKALKLASEKNVKVKLILSGKSDIPLLKNATLYFYGKYLKNNIEIFEWDKSILHGKAAVVDGEWSTIGSFNLNNLSSYASIEMNLGIHSQQFSANFQTHLNLIISECVKISSNEFEKKRTFLSKIKIRVSYWIIRLILNLATIIPYKRFLKSN
jgi:cardiolipin synthase